MHAHWDLYRDVPPPAPTAAPSVTTCSEGEVKVDIEIQTDNYGEETTWTLTNACTSEEVLKSEKYPNGESNNVVTQCLPPSEYDFTIMDTQDDGMCCGYGRGYYIITYDDEIVVDSTAEFETSETSSFGAACPEIPWDQIFLSTFTSGYDNFMPGDRANSNNAPSVLKLSQLLSGRYIGKGPWKKDVGSLFLREKDGDKSSIKSNVFDVSIYDRLQVRFEYKTFKFEKDEGFALECEFEDSSSWKHISSWKANTDFINRQWYNATEYITTNGASEARIRIRGMGNEMNDIVFIDNIEVLGEK